MQPIFDVLEESITVNEIKELIEANKIVTLPLAYMRGKTLKKSFVILDEAQNTTVKQMSLFLTRIGEGSKMVITGDPEQSDLGPYNGFKDALEIFADMKEKGHGLEIVTLCPESVVRHGIIPEISRRYAAKLPGGSKAAHPIKE